jgi:small subunit ribosomal protein S1
MESSSSGQQGRSAKKLRVGEVVEGPIVQIGKDSVFVDVGGVTEARIERAELEDKQGQLKVKVGDRVRASVLKTSDVMGPVLTLALGRGNTRGGLDVGALESARDSGIAVSGNVQKAVKAGLEVLVGGVRAFCPASQVDNSFIADLSRFEGQTLAFRVLEVKDGGRSVVLSRKALLEEERKREAQRVVEQLQVGSDYEGTVVSVQKYGAFVDLGGGVEGLVHVSELAHARVDRVEDVLSPGEKVQVRLLALEPGEKAGQPRLRLSLKALVEAPKQIIPEAGEILTGVVSKLTTFGVFVDTPKGSGLVPSRELGIVRGSDHRKQFPVGKEVQVVLLSRDDGGRLTFSIERVAGVEERQNYRDFAEQGQKQKQHVQAQPERNVGSFGELLQKRLGITASPAAERVDSSPAPLSQGPVTSAPETLPTGVPARTGAPAHTGPTGMFRRRG